MKNFVGLLLCALVALTVVASEARADGGFVRTPLVGLAAEQVAEYWTPQRMSEAIAYPMPERTMPNVMLTFPFEPSQATGPPAHVPGFDAVQSGVGLPVPPSQPPIIGATPPPSPITDGYDYPFPFSRFEVMERLYDLHPYRAVGKLFFTQNNTNYVCSASSISGDGNLVLTAGHCVSDGAGSFSSNVLFVPAYLDGEAPYGEFVANELSTFDAWHFGGSFCRDVGFIRVNSARSCPTCPLQSLGEAVGALGFGWNQEAEKSHWNDFGYPAASPFNGMRMNECQASFAEFDPFMFCSPLPHAIGCDQTGGSSGGPWIQDFVPGQAGSMNLANSLNSFKYTLPSQPEAMYGPYFDTAVNDLRETMAVP